MRYYSINVNPPFDIIFTFRGDDQKNTVTLPNTAPSFPAVQIGTDPKTYDAALTQLFGTWALRNGAGHTLIFEVDPNGNVKAWVAAGVV